MVSKVRELFTTVTIEGALLPPDILQRVTDGDSDLGGLNPEAYHLYGERLNEATNRAWNRLQGAWQAFKQAQERLPDDDLGTTITRERWLMVLFDSMSYGRLESATAVELDGKSYAISHRYKDVPIHLLSYKVDLDKRTPGVAGAATGSPHSMMQVFLNRTDEYLWGFLSNGYRLRILRDNLSLTRQAYIEFDLEAMMEGEVYSDFVLLYLLCHQSRVEAENPNDYWLENWRKAAEEQGKRALEDLRVGVEQAINCLGMGFLDHPHNTALRDALSDGSLDKQDYYRQLLRLVYRMLFLYVAEDRDLLHIPDASDQQRAVYQHYSTNKLRDIAANLRGTRHHDLYESLRLVMRLLGGECEGAHGLGLPVLGSFLFSDDAMPHLMNAQIANRDLLEAVRAISTVEDREIRRLRRVDFKNLGSEELGSVYESLLELHPDINLTARTFALKTAGGNERKTTGSYYTPTSLINALLDSALDPVLDEAIGAGGTRDEIQQRILDLKVVDPACGSGHFLIAAANRLAKRLATVRTGEDEPTPEHVTEAKRDVIANCIYGVDLNEMAVELCKVNLWLESIDPGKPLTFLDNRIQQGNSLLGTTPALMARGIPEDAFPTKSGLIEGDENKIVSKLRGQNRQELKDRQTGQRSMFELIEPPTDYSKLTRQFQQLAHAPDDTLSAVRTKERMYRAMSQDPEYIKGKFLADLWCSVFVWHKAENAAYQPMGASANGAGQTVPAPPTDLLYRNIEDNPLDGKWTDIRAYTAYLADRYDFFHWHIAFPEVFTVRENPGERTTPADETPTIPEITGWNGGFDVVLGNPPWEKVQLEEKKFFAASYPDIANASANKRKRLIDSLKNNDTSTFAEYVSALRGVAGLSNFIRYSNLYLLTGKGNISTHTVFIELSMLLCGSESKVGLIVPSGLVTQDGQKELYENLMKTKRLDSVFDFENRERLFLEVDSRMKFSIVIFGSQNSAESTTYAFYLYRVSDLTEKDRTFSLSYNDLELMSPNTLSCPTLRSSTEVAILKHIYENSQVILNERASSNPWGWNSWQMFNETHESSLFQPYSDECGGKGLLRHYEAKLMHQFDHRYGRYTFASSKWTTESLTTEEKQNPFRIVDTQYCLDESLWDDRAGQRGVRSDWIIAFRKITNATNERTAIFSIIPKSITGSQTPVVISSEEAPITSGLLSNLNSFVFDFAARRKVGATDLNHFIVHQLPVIPPHTYTQLLLDFIVPRVLELTYTAWDLQAFAQDVGYQGAPFVWDEERRFWLRAELDALYFHLYGISRDDVDYIMETFPIVKRKDIKATSDENGEGGTYRTKDAILEIYDEMANLPTMSVPAPKDQSATIDVPDISQWGTWLNPPPADSSVAHRL